MTSLIYSVIYSDLLLKLGGGGGSEPRISVFCQPKWLKINLNSPKKNTEVKGGSGDQIQFSTKSELMTKIANDSTPYDKKHI